MRIGVAAKGARVAASEDIPTAADQALYRAKKRRQQPMRGDAIILSGSCPIRTTSPHAAA